MWHFRVGFPRLAASVVVLLLLAWQATAAGPVDPEATSTIVGRITLGVKKSSVENATVLAYHLSTAQVFRSEPTLSNGKFVVTGLPYGYYDMAVETADGLYVGTQVINAPPDGKVVANLNLVPSEATAEGQRDFPGADQPPAGIANAIKGGLSKKGKIAISISSVVAAAVLLADDDDNKKSSSPSSPAP